MNKEVCIGVGSTGAPGAGAPLYFFQLTSILVHLLTKVEEPPLVKSSSYAYGMDAAAKKRPNTSGVGKINNYYEDMYIPPYNNID